MADNIVTFESESSPYKGWRIEQDHAPEEAPHGHKRDEAGNLIEDKPTGDGWISTVVGPNGQIIGPFPFLGEAIAAIKEVMKPEETPAAQPASGESTDD